MTYTEDWVRFNPATGVNEHCVYDVLDDNTVLVHNPTMHMILDAMGFSPVKTIDEDGNDI